MNENLNLVEILKDCPKGTKLYSTIFGEVKFSHIEIDKYPIVLVVSDGFKFRVAQDGKYLNDYNGECTLFPSKDQRDWSKFNPKKGGLVSTCEFKDGDILSYKCKGLKTRTIYIYRHRKRFNTSYYVALSGEDDEFRIDNTGKWALNGYNNTARLATEEEKQKLFQAIKDNGYKWNAETKTLEKLIEPKFKVGDKIVNRVNMYMGDLSHQSVISGITEDKYILNDGGYIYFKNQDIWELVPDKKQRFDPKTLKPFDKVLVRDFAGTEWSCDLFSYIENVKDQEESFMCTGCSEYNFCIPYNDKTKHLVGTTKEAPEYYRYWEK